ncbi:hypothetical protein ScPMuIL_015472 [Solemya velum]
MSLAPLVDAGGEVLKLYDMGGIYSQLPPRTTPREMKAHIDALKYLKIRPDDVFLFTYPKSGTHWLWEIVGMLLSGRSEYNKNVKESQMLECQDLETLESLPSPRLLNTHMLPDRLPDNFLSSGCEVINILRNPKDVAVSLFHHIRDFENSVYNGLWSDFLPLFLGEQSKKCNTWEKILQKQTSTPVLNIWYEDLHENPVSEIQRVAEFLQVDYTIEDIANIADKCSFQNLYTTEMEIRHGVKARTRFGTPLMFRKGVVGDWKNYFTVAQNERFNRIYREQMNGSQLSFGRDFKSRSSVSVLYTGHYDEPDWLCRIKSRHIIIPYHRSSRVRVDAMSVEKLYDGGGEDYFEIIDLGDLQFAVMPHRTSPEDALKRLGQIKKINMKSDDILIINYMKSGTHWIWEIVSMLVEGKAEYNPNAKESRMLEIQKAEELEKMETPRILNTHYPYELLPENVGSSKCKIIYMLRNPKDVAVSLYHHLTKHDDFRYNGTWPNFLQLYLGDKLCVTKPWFRYVRDWEKVIDEHPELNIHTCSYEDLKKDPVTTVENIAAYLGISVDKDLVNEVIDKCSFEKLSTVDDWKHDACKAWGKDGKSFMYRKGEVGDWKNWFTVAQNEQFDAVYREKMAGTKLKFLYDLKQDKC